MTNDVPNSANRDYLKWQAGKRLAALADARQRRLADMPPARNLAELLAADDTEYVHLVFRTFLDRSPNAREQKEGEARLRSGEHKLHFAVDIAADRSTDNITTSDLASARRRMALERLPGIGGLTRFCRSLLGLPGSRRALLATQQQLAALRADNQLLRNQLEATAIELVAAQERQREDSADLSATQDTARERLADNVAKDLASLRDRQAQLESALQRHVPAGRDEGASGDSDGTPVDDDFYIAFEDYFRGSREAICQRLEYYLPVIDSTLPPTLAEAPMADIGCGRGEWLQLMTARGYDITGIDLNDRNVENCRARGLNAIRANGLQWLRQRDSQSLGLISSFHVIEHMTLAQLNSLLIEALRCLAPGGLIILETPNPQNLLTAAHRFYTDPTHRNPIPPELCEFLLTYKGFTDVNVHPLHPGERVFEGDSALENTLNRHFSGPQDYAVVATRP